MIQIRNLDENGDFPTQFSQQSFFKIFNRFSIGQSIINKCLLTGS